MDLREQLQASLGSAYTLESELGGGGMSRVFVALETALGRRVVVKVLPPEMTQGVSVERFRREIQLAAQLQHPHIVPVHSSGETEGLPFYTMPLVEGPSLRSRLARGGALPIGETIGVLREVAKALAYAHERGVVHRDIKPDNVLLTGGSAVVTDFGIAKALSASRMKAPGGTLTQIGTSIGTPAYMAPEQAAADPGTDHRADIYSFGCVAYEMLAGQPPFAGRTPHRLLAAHMGEKPQPIGELRADTPPLLADLVMKCLEKEPDQRPQSALDLVKVLDSVTTSGTAHPAMPQILLGGRPRLGGALALYVAAFVSVAVVAKAAIVGIGLPTWVLPGAVIVMALGLPMILFTAFVHHGAHQAMTMAQLTPGGSATRHSTMTRLAVQASPWLNWRRTTMGGVVAFGVFILLVAGYMVTRALGIGPAGSLMGAGVMGAREKLLVADFKSPAGDSTMGPVVTEAFRSDLAQSPSVDVVQPTTVREVLRRMQRPPEQRVDYALGREIATREGIKAVIDGEVLALGGGYVIAAKLISAQTGDVLASFRVSASAGKDIIPAIDQLAREVRTRIGESLKSVNSAPPLEQVTTPSLPALRKYVQSLAIFNGAGEFERGIALLDEAIALDTGFAMAYRKLAIELGNQGGFAERTIRAIEKAYAHRERLSEPERYLTEAAYWANGPKPDENKTLAAYEALLELQPTNGVALNNAAIQYTRARRFDKAETLARRAVATNPTSTTYYENLIEAQLNAGKVDDAQQSLDSLDKHVPGSFIGVLWHTALLASRDRFDSVQALSVALHDSRSGKRARRDAALGAFAAAATRGRLAEAERWRHESAVAAAEAGIAAAPLRAAADLSLIAGWYRGDLHRAESILDEALRATPLGRIAPIERPYLAVADAYAHAGRPDRARTLLAGFDSTRKTVANRDDEQDRHSVAGQIAMAAGDFPTAITELRAADHWLCPYCLQASIGRAYDLSGNADSALAAFARFADHRYGSDGPTDALYLAGVYKRLGELYDARGDVGHAATYYGKFVALWKDADPELRPKVEAARKRLASLARQEKR